MMVLFCAAAFAVISVTFGIEFAEETGGCFVDVAAENFVVRCLE